MNVLELESVTKTFGGIRAVQKVDAAVAEASITAIIGPNGAGKTTLFNMISGVYQPSAGKVFFGGRTHELTRMPAHRISSLGVSRTFQNIRLFANLTVLDNVKIGFHSRTKSGFFGALLPFLSSKEERDIALAGLKILDFVGLGAEAGMQAGSLPYGKQRLVEIARALAAAPALLLLDEPAAGMNPTESDTLVRLIRKIRGAGITVVMIEHHMSVVMEISDYLYVLDHGEKISEGPPSAVCADAKVIEAYLGCEQGRE